MDEVYHSDKTPVATCLFTGLFYQVAAQFSYGLFFLGHPIFSKSCINFQISGLLFFEHFLRNFLHLNGHQFELEIFNGNKPQKLEGGEDG